MSRLLQTKIETAASTAKPKAAAAHKKPSPDSVAWIDLTEMSDDDDFAEQNRRFGKIRRELEPPSARKRKGGLKTTGLDDDNDVIVLDCSSDEDDESGRAIADIAHKDNNAIVADKAASPPMKKARVKKEGEISSSSAKPKSVETDGVEVVEPTNPKLAAATMVAESGGASTSNNDEVVVEGVLNETRLPHMRQHCTRFPHKSPKKSIFSNYFVSGSYEANSESCDLCYCYVCDCPVKDCNDWFSADDGAPKNNHCCATDTDPMWKVMRSRAKSNNKDGASEFEVPDGFHLANDCDCRDRDYYGWGGYESEDETCDSCWCYICDEPFHECRFQYRHLGADPSDEWSRNERLKRSLSTFGKVGPFEPNTPDAHLDKELTKCRHCSWFVRLPGNRMDLRKDPGMHDWCLKCGRVASEDDLEKNQREPDKETNNYFVGEKEIPFRIKAHDPRLCAEYKKAWEEADPSSPGWHFDEAEHEEEVFLHRIGRSPKLQNILSLLPRVTEENIPKTCSFKSEAIIIEDPNHYQLVRCIIGNRFMRTKKSFIDIYSTWNKESRTGILKLRFTLPHHTFVGSGISHAYVDDTLPIILGLWFGIFPLQPSEIFGRWDISTPYKIMARIESRMDGHVHFKIPVEPFSVRRLDALREMRNVLDSRFAEFKAAKEANETRLSLAPSDGSRFSGGVCTSDSSGSLRDILVRFFSEHSKLDFDFDPEAFFASCRGALIRDEIIGKAEKPIGFDFVLGHASAVTASMLYEEGIRYERSETKSINHMMVSLENLGHEPEDCVEGLNIELLEFQRQSLKWALEREKIPGGVQSYHWSKLPSRGEGHEDLYFNPVLKRFRKDKPAVVRGGFIAEQMGLGKTVISLALILKNPAPEFPISASPISALNGNTPPLDSSGNPSAQSHGWEKKLYSKTSASNKKKGSILCRGTLVICPVSLVGQWIDEAKSKLKDPGLIYPYHGSKRCRNSTVLASNSIVVTTYDVLSSDATYHAKNAGPQYCPPLAQIRWWRIICDEGHSLRSNAVRSRSLQALVADHKWIVSGTPMNTSHEDLRNQLKFLGFDHVDKMFELMTSKQRGSSKEIMTNNLMYFLRPIMIRHSQEQKYRGTNTTLMSLPPKTERKEIINLTASEKKELDKIDNATRQWYLNFRSQNLSKMSSHFLKVSSKLTSLRIACSGGRYPLFDMDKDEDDNENANQRKAPVYSNFVFESKLNTLLAHLKKYRDNEPESKSLVFSQFSSTLSWLKIELPKHGFQFRTLSGDMSMVKRAKALSDFQKDPPTTIFLLSMRAGAVGINLTQANRVFLMEPSFNPALEAQAIGRIHRLGQKRPVEIVRLVVKDSFEERMVGFLEKKYGQSTGKKSKETGPDGNEKDESENQAPRANVCNATVGNLTKDKAELVTEEFDVLFGVDLPTEKPAITQDMIRISDKENGSSDDDEFTSLGYV